MFSDHFQFASETKSKQLLNTPDKFTQSWSPFDIQARLMDTSATPDRLFNYIQDQVLEWTDEEMSYTRDRLEYIGNVIQESKLNIQLPDTIYLVKTTGLEEGSAVAYTRSNYIVFKSGIASMDQNQLDHLILHELFHVLSRLNPDFRKNMYDIIGFKLMPELDYPDDIADLRITNPDAPQTDSYIQLKVDGEERAYMMVLYASKPYNGTGGFFEYLKVGFLRLKNEANQMKVDPDLKIYSLGEMAGFFDKIGRNTSYIIHPEEIMAENFAMTILANKTAQDEWILEKVSNLLKS